MPPAIIKKDEDNAREKAYHIVNRAKLALDRKNYDEAKELVLSSYKYYELPWAKEILDACEEHYQNIRIIKEMKESIDKNLLQQIRNEEQEILKNRAKRFNLVMSEETLFLTAECSVNDRLLKMYKTSEKKST